MQPVSGTSRTTREALARQKTDLVQAEVAWLNQIPIGTAVKRNGFSPIKTG